MEHKECLCRTCENQDKNGYCSQLQDDCSMICKYGVECFGMTECFLYKIKQVVED